MKHLIIQKTAHQQLLKDFKYWCTVRGYALKTNIGLITSLQELLFFIEKRQLPFVGSTFNAYILYIQERPNERQGGGLSTTSIKKQCWMLRLLVEYLDLVKGITIEIQLPQLGQNEQRKWALSQKHIQQIYHWIEQHSTRPYFDKAILTIFYSCGLRRSEGLRVQLKHIQFRKSNLLVPKGKGGKSRLIPLTQKAVQDLRDYIAFERYEPPLNSPYYQDAFLFASRYGFTTNQGGQAMGASPFMKRLAIWQQLLDVPLRLTLHILRHSIATHFLQKGMDMELIQDFLGHRSLAATQSYTHISPIDISSNDEL